MSRKLPKATAETLDDIRRRPRTTRAAPVTPPPPQDDQAPPEAPSPAPSDAADTKPPLTVATIGDATALRRARAGEIVERHAAYAAVGGLLPLPFVDTLGVMAVVALMIEALAKLHGQDIGKDRVRTLVASLAGGFGQAGAGVVTTAAFAKLVPGANILGIMTSSVAAAAMTRTIGRAFVLHFETGGTALTFDASAIRAYFASQPTSRQ
ncbi:DUF697 domain-containing protein [Pleomorphomonas sp. NRK KF1]|uniref:DUF697 domain-containing protein n=1 Tax=Pleomorphomonas sp. NRK KF1 TaxID=2943000 RepID=UPI00204343CE|nr:DUF697 domain-containing protein [Pleomorphomonas sp. NRK KF1]MCM5553300.1 YcjF family protein [Pleomorphomonas sp. NRK KF1]